MCLGRFHLEPKIGTVANYTITRSTASIEDSELLASIQEEIGLNEILREGTQGPKEFEATHGHVDVAKSA